jgi:hypothetical protein
MGIFPPKNACGFADGLGKLTVGIYIGLGVAGILFALIFL